MGGKYKKTMGVCNAFFSYNSGAVRCLRECYDRALPEMCRKRKQPDKCSRTGIFRHGRRTQTIR